jgi:uncharacterized membrane protein YfcA
MGILEIILTIFAWRNGWKWLSIIPLCTAFVLGFLLGMSGVLPTEIIFVDVLTIVALVIMCVKKPTPTENDTKKTKEEDTTK